MQLSAMGRKQGTVGARRMPGLVLLALALAAGTAPGAEVRAPRPGDGTRGAPAAEPGGALTLDRAVAIAEQRYRARVVRATTEESGGHRTYVLRLLSGEGRVWTVRVDAQSGAMN